VLFTNVKNPRSEFPRKHALENGVTFEEAITALADPYALEAADLLQPRRHITIGRSGLLRLLFVVHLEIMRSGHTRIISARRASPAQRRKYEEG